jgi:histidinol-phosphate aminotransferase
MSIRIPEYIQNLKAYTPGRPIADVMQQYGLEHVVKLASNENPLGPSPKAVEEMRKSLWEMHYYPNGGRTIREAIAAKNGLEVDQVIAGSGSEGVMNTFMRTFLEVGDEVVTSEGTFTGFYVLAGAMGLKVVTAPMKDLAYDLDAIAERVTPNTRLVYLANPNNPTGSVFGREAFERFYAKLPKDVLVMHDEAYYDFAIADVADYYTLLTDIRPNVITLRTFSKSHGLAGIRIGYATGPKEIIQPMLAVKLPFEPSVTAQAAGLGALEDDEFLARTVQTNLAGKQYLAEVFESLGLSYVPTAANFFCLPMASEEQALLFTSAMEQRGVIIRPLAGFGLPTCVRISIGTEEQNETAAHAMREILELQETK